MSEVRLHSLSSLTMATKIVTDSVTRQELETMAREEFGDLVKAVVDIARECMAVGGEMHADGEALLLENGSRQQDIWGINLYPRKPEEEWIEFDSMINIRPSQGNRSRGVENADTRERIKTTIKKLVTG